MVILRIQELAEDKGITLEELSQISGITVEKVQKYAGESIEIQEDSAADLRTIAKKLNVRVVELVKPVAKRGAFELKIQEIAKEKGITFAELSKKTKVHPAIIVFYSTQAICKNKLCEPKFQLYLSEISKALDCSVDDLKVAAELPSTLLRIEEFARERGLTLKQVSQLTETPDEFIELMDSQPVDIQKILEIDNFVSETPEVIRPIREVICCILRKECCQS